MKYEVNRLSDALGAEIKGFDLSKPLNDEILNEILNLLYEHQVLVFRDQDLVPMQQIRFCEDLGKLIHCVISNNTSENRSSPYPELRVLSNITRNGEHFGYRPPPVHLWHSDLCFHPVPIRLTTLHSRIVPEQGGDTLFANMYAAYKALPEEIKQKIDNLDAVFSATASTEKIKARSEAIGHIMPPTPISFINIPDVIHPVVTVHPVTKQKAIFVNDAHTDRILGLPEEESRELLQKICAHSIRPEFRYDHRYVPGDLVMLDNPSLIHTSTYTDPKYPRLVHRVWLVDQKSCEQEEAKSNVDQFADSAAKMID